ncbi:putative membrane protein (plasmid) [Clostridium botulinum]|uniref:Putative membrane protein n=1 Tax=Clostridium botulinum TaxID=1491 RepID=A0A1L7JMZ6_CLOBO|nr:putative membrane protein [Clostridium botulinum]
MLDQILRASFIVISAIFIFYYIAFFMFKMLGFLNEDKDFIYELKNQTKNKAYTYASFNFVIIILLSCGLRSFELI